MKQANGKNNTIFPSMIFSPFHKGGAVFPFQKNTAQSLRFQNHAYFGLFMLRSRGFTISISSNVALSWNPLPYTRRTSSPGKHGKS